jgi:hypothetical protein
MRYKKLASMSPVALAACGILGPDSTTVSGRVLENGVPVVGAVVEMLVERSGTQDPFSLALVAQDTTDGQGHYDVAHSSEDTSCFGVRVAAASRRALRLTSLSGSTVHFRCRGPGGDIDLGFTRNIWYGGISAEPDTVTIGVGGKVSLQAEFFVTDRRVPGVIHRDSVPDWVWVGDEGWSWTWLETFLYEETDRRYCDALCNPPPGQITLRARGPGTAKLIVTLTGSPFADTVTLVVN